MTLPGGWRPHDNLQQVESGQAWVTPVHRDGEALIYALKRLKNPRRSGRFEREITLMRDLASRGVPVPPVVDEGVDSKGRPYFVMPWYSRGSLEDWGGGTQSVIETLNLCIQIADALRLCHAARVAHRDIKPANILLSDDGQVLLADLGLARERGDDRLTELDEAVGSRFYIAPENESGMNLDNDQRPADFYAFGKVMWVLLTGRTPLPRELILEAGNRLETVRDDNRLAPLDTVLEELLDRDPRSRLNDWADVTAELARVRDSFSAIVPIASDDERRHEKQLLAQIRRLAADSKTTSSVRAREAVARRRERWQEIQSALGQRVAELVDDEVDRVNEKAAEAGVVVRRSAGGPSLERLKELPAFGELNLDELPTWAKRTGAAVLLTIEGGPGDLMRRVYVAMFTIPNGDRVIFARAPFCYREGEGDFLIIDPPPPFVRVHYGPRMSLDSAIHEAHAFAEESVRVARLVWIKFAAALADGRGVESAVGL